MGVSVLTPAATIRLATLAHTAAELGLSEPPSLVLVDRLITEASDAIATYCRRTWGRHTLQETLPGTNRRLLGLTHTPVVSVSEVLEDDIAITDYTIEEAATGALARENGWGASLARGWDMVAYSSSYILPLGQRWRYAVTYVAGYRLPDDTYTVVAPAVESPSLPSAVEHACLETVKAWYHARAGRDIQIERMRVADVLVQYAPQSAIGALPAQAVQLLAPWRPGFGG